MCVDFVWIRIKEYGRKMEEEEEGEEEGEINGKIRRK